MYYNEDEIRRIKDASSGHLIDVIQDFRELQKSGVNYVCTCPKCKASKKFSVSPAKQVFNCFACRDLKGGDALSYLMTVENMEFVAALEFLVSKFSVLLDKRSEPVKITNAPSMKKGSKAAKGANVDTYCARMLSESGLTYEDVTAKVYKLGDKKSIFETRTFRPGTIDEFGNLSEKGDDVIIEYFDIEGYPVTYARKDQKRRETGDRKEYYRVRWQFKEAHLSKEGKPSKYKSPYGSSTPIYIPEKMRNLYQSKTPVQRLYIQEGEKKAEKACKHGIPSIAVSGIQNLGLNGLFPEDLISIITTCCVKEVAFIFDSDWDDISDNIRINDRVDMRPRFFYSAARNFKEYMRELKNRNIYVEIFVGHISKNENGDKGLDDLLANSLRGREEELAQDFEFACNEKKGIGKYVEMYKVTTWTDHKLQELWCLHSHEAFAARHKDILRNLPEFLFSRYRWKFDESGAVVMAQPFDEDEQFWKEVEKENRSGDKRIEYEFCYVNSQNFLQNRGFGRYRGLDGSCQFIHLDPPIVRSIEASDARDFLFQFAKHNCKTAINEMLIKGVSQYIGPDKLSLLEFVRPNFIKPDRESQYLYFDKSCWLVMRDNVTELGYENIKHQIWEEQKKPTPAKYLGKPLITFSNTGVSYTYQLSKEGEKCHFLQFLINTSNFTWRKKTEETEPEEAGENIIHLLSKMCAIGYMAMDGKDNNVARAVVGMDGKQSEVGESNGRSGKSLIGELMRNVTPTAYIPGKRSDLFNDQFVWNDVQENTKIVFIDDVLQNFNFEFLFPNITGDWSVNYKGGRRVTIPFERSAKIYIATNHAIRGSGSSFADRQWLLAFSDFYNEKHKPTDDFGTLFFLEWDYAQWNLAWNMIANCVQLYLTYGVIQAPGERLEQRKIRQEMGETLISWAEEYFSDTAHINARLVRKDLYDSFCSYDPAQRKFISPTNFKKKFVLYCKWKGYVFNPQKYDSKTGNPFQTDKDGSPVIDDKSGGVEYFTIGTADRGKEIIRADSNDPLSQSYQQSIIEY